jgi:hypothetical protein
MSLTVTEVIPGLQACPGMIEAGGIQFDGSLWIPAFAGMTYW